MHESGYRPTSDEAELAYDEAQSILFPLASFLDLHDDIKWYRMRQSQRVAPTSTALRRSWLGVFTFEVAVIEVGIW